MKSLLINNTAYNYEKDYVFTVVGLIGMISFVACEKEISDNVKNQA